MAGNLAGKALFNMIQSMETCWFLSKNGGIIEIESDLHVSPSPLALSMAIGDSFEYGYCQRKDNLLRVLFSWGLKLAKAGILQLHQVPLSNTWTLIKICPISS